MLWQAWACILGEHTRVHTHLSELRCSEGSGWTAAHVRLLSVPVLSGLTQGTRDSSGETGTRRVPAPHRQA